MEELSLNSLNKTAYERDGVIKYYREAGALLDAERVLFDKLYPVIKDSKILDIGIGGGRTTKYLLEISDDYTGVDYVQGFVDETAKRYPKARVFCGDARDLHQFADESFDFLLFSYNGLDCVAHDGRLKAIGEFNRVLRKGGTLMFSSHNRDYKYFKKLPWRWPFRFECKYLIFLLHCLVFYPIHLRMKKFEVFADDHAIFNDGDHRYSLLLYYISIEKQREQLQAAGFSDVGAYSMSGEPVTEDTDSHWIQYVSTKL